MSHRRIQKQIKKLNENQQIINNFLMDLKKEKNNLRIRIINMENLISALESEVKNERLS